MIPQQWCRNLFRSTSAARKRAPQRRPRQARLQTERLEDRLVPTLTGLASFSGANGSMPVGNLAIDGSGNLYGTTVFGGTSFNGTVFEVLKGSGTITTLANFNNTNGAHPYGGLVVDGSGNVYGTTRDGGASGNGTVFEVVAGSGTVTSLATFSGANGANPTGNIVLDGSGNLFGTTEFGGSAGQGTVFEVSGSTLTTLASFTGTGTNGANPQAGVFEDGSGNLLGTTLSGGSANNGTIFSIPSTGGSISTLTSFTTVRGPYSGVIEDASGNLFGTTSGGGGGFGTVYELQSGHSTILTLATFSNTNGANPSGNLVENGSGTLFGTTTNGGGSGKGTVFEVPSTGGVLNTLATLTGASGANSQAGLAMDGSNNLFGVAANGGASGNGAVFEVQPFPSFTSTTLSNWTVNQPGYNQTIGTVGGTGNLSFATTSGALPTGLTLSTSGILSGTPTVQASYTFTVTVTDSLGASAGQSYTVTINPPLAITTTSIAKGRVGSPYTQTISASGGTGSYTFSQTAGTLPAGVTLSTSGLLSGMPSAGGAFSFTVMATDSTGASASRSYSVIMGTFLTLPSSGFSGQESGTVLAFPISINQLEDAAAPTNHVGLASASFAISYPTGVFNFPMGGNLATASVHLGSVPLSDTVAPGGASDWTLTANSPEDGVLDISLTVRPGNPSKAIASDTGGGSLVTIDFPVSPNYNPATPTAQVISAMSVIDATHTSVTGSNGSYLLDPSAPYRGSITINPAPQFPPTVTSPQSYFTEANTTLNAPAPGLLNGASDPQGQSMMVNVINGAQVTLGTPVTLSSGASVTVNNDGSFSYSPANNFVGADSFTFTVVDMGGNVSSAGTVNVHVVPTLSLVPEGTTSGPDGTVITEDVVMDNPNPTGGVGPLAGFNVAVAYDPSAVTTSAANVTLGSDVPHSWDATINDTTPGVLAIGAFGTLAGDQIWGPAPLVLAKISFTITAGSNQITPIKLVPSVAAGSGTATTVLTGIGGTFTLNPGLSGPLFMTGVDTSIQVTGESTTVTINPNALPNGDQGVAYSQTLNAVGGVNGGPFSYSFSGTLPPGLTFTTVNDPQFVLSGTPTTPGTYTFTVTATDAASDSGSQSYTVVINPAVSITTTALGAWTVNQPGYNQTITATGGSGSYTFSQTAGTLPTGLTLSASGVLSGTPTATGSYSFTVSATDTIGSSASKSFTVVVNPAVTIPTTALVDWTVNTGGYNQTIKATGGTGTDTFAVTSGTLPTGLTLGTSGVLSGTPTATSTYTFTVTATDTTGASGSASYTVTINPGVAITTTTLPTWTAGKAFSQTITATGGTGGTYKFTKTGGTLPAGLTLSTAGVLSGTPSASGNYTFTITATDSVGGTGSQSFTEMFNPAITITTVALAPWTINVPNYSQTVTATGGTGSLTFSIAGGSLPTGLTLNGSSGVISGTPTVAVSSQPVMITATDTIGATGSNPYTVTINPAVAITTTALGNWTVNQPNYSQTVHSTGGTAPITYSVTGGTLPTGVALNSSTGVLSGTPTATGPFTFTVTASDSLSSSGTPSTTASQTYTVTINSPVTITTTSLTTPWTANLAGYSQTITATNGTPAYTFSKASGTIPTGLSLNTTTGVLSGKPTAAGTFTFTIAATDVAGSTATQSYTILVNPAVTITTTALPNWTVNIAGYNQTITATGGTGGSLTFAATSGTLPTGLTLSTTGVLSGTPTAKGSFTFTVTATDSLGATGTKSYTVTVNAAVSVTSTTLAAWTVNSPGYSQTVSTTGGTGTITFAATGGTVPTGLTLSTSGVLSGTPTAAGSYTFTVTATDSLGSTGSQNITVVINPVVAITTTALANGTLNQAGYSQTISTSGGTGLPTFATSGGTLPAGLTLSTAGVLSGKPTALGTYSFTVTATDKTGSSASQAYSVTIFPAATQLTLTAPSTAIAGTPFSVTISATDSMGNPAGAYSGTVTLASRPGADISPTSVAVTNGTATVLVTLTTAGTQTVTASASGLTAATASIAVSHGALGSYLVSLVGSGTIQAGSPILATVQAADAFGNPITTGYSGPASVTAGITPSTTASSFPQTIAINGSGFGVFAGVIDPVGSYTLSVSDGTFSGHAANPVTITPGTPAKLAFAAQPQNTPTGDKLPAVTVNVLDSFGNLVTGDNTDSVSISVAGGPGSILPGSTTTATASSGVASFSNLTLATLGAYTLRATDAALSSLATSTSFSVTPIQVVAGSLATSPSGFSLSFNAPYLVNSVTPALYGTGFKGSATVTPTVTLTQTTGTAPPGFTLPYQVQGSVILNPATNSLTFLATNVVSASSSNGAHATPILADGTYVIRVTSSSPNGLQAFNSGGGSLDGTGAGTPGHDYTASFTVGAAAAGDAVVWVPATADGPGQPLAAPGQNHAPAGYPVYLDSTGGATAVQATINYNPSLLTVTPTSTATFTVTVPVAGQAVVTYNGPALPAGVQTLIGDLTATVPSGTTSSPVPYKAKDLLHLSGVTLNGSSTGVVSSDGLHVVAYVGDADGSGSYSSNDAVLITRVLLSADTGFAAYPLIDPVILADTDGSGFTPSDAALQANEAGVGFPTANLASPPIPTGVTFTPIGNNVDPSVTLPSQLQVGADGTVTVAVNLDDADPAGSTGLTAGHLALTYDPRAFTVSAADVHLGSLLAGRDWSVTPTIDPSTGQIAIALSSATPITRSIGGSLVTIDFHQVGEPGGVSPRSSTPIALVGAVNVNGQTIQTELEDAQGAFTLSPAPSSGSTGLLASVVTLGAPVPVQASLTPAATEATTGVLEVSSSDTRPAQPPVLETAGPASAAALDEIEPEGAASPLAGEAPALHVSVVAAHATIVAAATSSVTAAPLSGLVFQLAGTPTFIAQANGVAGWQHVADQLFQALGRTTASASDPALVGVVQTLERALAGQLFLSQPASDDVDSLNWEDAGSDLDLNAPTQPPHQEPSTPTPAPAAVSDHVALDQIFSEDADDSDLMDNGE